MNAFGSVDWRSVFVPDTPLLEIFVRGSVIYLALFLLLRMILKRQTGTVGVTDLLVVVLIADCAQNAMAHDYKSIPDGLMLAGTVIFWSFALNWVGFHFPRLGRLIHPPPLQLIRDGEVMRQNLRRELVTREELDSQLREQGIDDVSQVRGAYMEGDGRISVVRYDGAPRPRRGTRCAGTHA